MIRMMGIVPLLVLAIGCAGKPERRETAANQEQDTVRSEKETQVQSTSPTSPLDFTMTSIDGETVPLSKYRGQVVMIVNVASKCGYTRQYTQLQALHERYADKGLAVLGFPANDFGRQEPGTNKEIMQFCTSNYGVEFDMFAKIATKGADQSPLYTFLTDKQTNPEFGGGIKWNFTKFLVDREGKVIARFGPGVRPDDPKVVALIESELQRT